MQEWIIAMLVVSILLILRDMAKTVFSGKTKEKEEMLPLCESHPQKEKVPDPEGTGGGKTGDRADP